MRSLVVVVLVGACSNTTGGDLIALPFVAGGTAVGTFTTPTGWSVTLDRAAIAAGPFYFNVDPPPTDEFRSGVVIVQATEQTIIDALDPTTHAVAGGANGETGSAVAVEIGLLAPDSTNLANPNASMLDSGFAYVAGTAVDGATTVAFEGEVIVDPSLVTSTEPLADLQRIRGASVALSFTAAPETLELRVDPTHWFDQSDFSQIAAAGGTWTVDTTFAAQLLEGVKGETGVYQFDLVPTTGAM
ncbi:MAG TPA: hypothetical protein VH143_25035 [Kofleriaceae bacterium]|jgi:hypothetical protein|nr:hypothetical protein [Kofleriaceae bacterium]